jgi:uncharacterized protein (TIGR04255 family)
MSTDIPVLRFSPIVEAVLDVDYDVPPGFQFSALEPKAREAFGTRYPKFRTQFLQEHRIQAQPDQQATVSFNSTVGALQFLQDDEKQLVQLRPTGFSFNRLAPYTSLDDYLPEIERSWRDCLTIVSPVQIRLVRLRFINRLLLPAVAGKVNLDEYFTTSPRLPPGIPLTFDGFLNQHAAIEEGTGHHVTLVMTNQPMEESGLPIILDNSVAAEEPADPSDWAWLLSRIQSLRSLKNRVFHHTLTEKCLNLYR